MVTSIFFLRVLLTFGFLLSFSGRLIPENIYTSRQEVLVEKHKNDDHNWHHCADHHHHHHPLCNESHLNPRLKQSD